MDRMLESEEAARRLGVKLATLYAYVSRGLLVSYPAPDPRRSLFDLEEIERFAKRSRLGRQVESKLATVATAITQVRDDGPWYRGRSAVDLAGSNSFEQVAAILWETDLVAEGGWRPVRLPGAPSMRPRELLSWGVVMCAAADPLRSDLRPRAVVDKATRVIASLAGSSPARRDGLGPASIAERLTRQIAGEADPRCVRAVDAALVLLADHELATSTVAVRVAASTRADLYDALLAGLATLGGPLHGGASELAYDLLAACEREGPEQAVDAALRHRGRLAGFGHGVYGGEDPRGAELMMHAVEMASPTQLDLLQGVVELADAHDLAPPDIDLGLAALALVAGLPGSAGPTIFSVARLAGFTAHYLEELSEAPLRYRARAVYATAPPGGTSTRNTG